MATVGLHLEGEQDEEAILVLLARLLGVARTEVSKAVLTDRSRGYEGLIQSVEAALLQFWSAGLSGVIVGVDNDGTPTQGADGATLEDPSRPRHAASHREAANQRCRHCRLRETVERARRRLVAGHGSGPAAWPVVIAVPVEALESWLLWGADVIGRPRVMQPEDLPVSELKTRLYGRKRASWHDFRVIGLPIAERMDLDGLRRDVPSFRLFAEAVERDREALLTEPKG